MTVTTILEDAALAARHKCPTLVDYERLKDKLSQLGLGPEKYQWAVKELAERLGL